jgi:ferredoxin
MTKFNGSRRFPNIKKINTRRLVEVINSVDGRTEAGSDYGPLLHDIEQELYRRQHNIAKRKEQQFERDQLDYDLHINGRQCTQCKVYYPLDTIDANFYKVAKAPHRYRPRCKACHVKASRTIRALNKIKIEEIPF